MKIFDTTVNKVSEIALEVNKGFGGLTIETEKTLANLTTEKINVQIQRANGDNVEITNGNIPLKEFLIIGTIGDDAIGSNPSLGLQVRATVELVDEDASAIHLYDKDLIRISLSGLDDTKVYRMFGHEAPLTTDSVLSYERKSMNSEHENMDFDATGYDACIITDKSTITEINLRFDNGNVVKTTPEEIKMQHESFDPIAQVKLDGSTLASFSDYVQLPLKGIVAINIRKEQGDIVNLLFRHDQELK